MSPSPLAVDVLAILYVHPSVRAELAKVTNTVTVERGLDRSGSARVAACISPSPEAVRGPGTSLFRNAGLVSTKY